MNSLTLTTVFLQLEFHYRMAIVYENETTYVVKVLLLGMNHRLTYCSMYYVLSISTVRPDLVIDSSRETKNNHRCRWYRSTEKARYYFQFTKPINKPKTS